MLSVTPLRAIMEAEGRRQSWLAQRIGLHQSEVSRIINRGLIPDLEIRQAIADALGRRVEELWPDLTPLDADSERSAAA